MTEKRKTAKRLWILTLVCLSIPVGYVLSIGPVGFVARKFKLQDDAIDAFYSPIITYIQKHQNPPSRFMLTYLEFWWGISYTGGFKHPPSTHK